MTMPRGRRGPCRRPAPAALRAVLAGLLMLGALPFSLGVAAESLAITGVTVIDGSGAAPQRNTTVVVEGGVIKAIGSDAAIPASARRIDGSGKYLLPGFIDSNVHATIYGNSRRRETVVRYGEHNDKLALEFAQRQLKYGVTTIRDSYGALEPLVAVRDRIEAGDAIGARMLVAGNIVGWGGPFSLTFSLMPESELTLFQAQWNDSISQGVGEELMDMGPEEVREAMRAYIGKGPDFIKYGGTSHFFQPSLITFSPRIQKVIVDEAHRAGLIAETHATSPESLRLAVEAGIDLIQHPEILSRDYPDALIDLIVGRDVICAMRSNTLAGEPWQEFLRSRRQVETELAAAPAPRSSAERREREQRLRVSYERERRNAQRLIERGCRVTIATDNYQGQAPEFRKTVKPEIQEAGIGSILAIEGLVELGMSEMDAIVAATRNGAIAAGMLDRIGTVEEGKEADLLLLAASPLDDISNIRRLDAVIARGQQVDIAALPEQVLFYTGPMPSGATRPQLPPASPAVAAAAAMPAQQAVAPAPAPAKAEEEDPERSGLPIASISTSPNGKFIVTLENGEIWRQLNSDDTQLAIPDRERLTAEIKRTFFGTTTLKISGTYRAFKVTRIDNAQ